jgi:Flp pilus assembly protein TadG
MLWRLRRARRLFCRDQQGSYAVEFAIILPVFLLLVFGIVDFGHAWYMRHVMVNASREGARYGSRYQTDALGNRVCPKNLSPSVTNYVLNTSADNGGTSGWGLKSLLPACSNPVVTPGGPAATESNPTVLAGEDLTVTITATKTWLVLGKLVPGFSSTKTITATTDMKCE